MCMGYWVLKGCELSFEFEFELRQGWLDYDDLKHFFGEGNKKNCNITIIQSNLNKKKNHATIHN